MKKPKYKWIIFDKIKKKAVKENNKVVCFEFVRQAENYIYKRLGNSPVFVILDIKKLKK